MLNFDPDRPTTPPRPAATTLVLRDHPSGLELLGILRHPKSTFLGGVLAFPGGKVDETDRGPSWDTLAVGEPPRGDTLAATTPARVLAIAACRELIEEVGVAPIAGVDHATALALQARLKAGESLEQALRADGLTLQLGALHLFGRWITPEAEARRYDATFFVLEAPAGQQASSDQHETTAVMWATPAALLARWEAGELQMAPPTTRMLELLRPCATVAEALALAARQTLAPVCPRYVPDDHGGFLALPGDPAHEVAERRVEGPTRFVLHDGRFVSAEAPAPR